MIDQDFEIVIATYNRKERVVGLVKQLLQCYPRPKNVIVVDSSNDSNSELHNVSQVIYLRSSHKNQPYQRYLGWRAATSEYLVFFDDDMEIVEPNFLRVLKDEYTKSNAVGIMTKMCNKHEDTVVLKTPRSRFAKLQSRSRLNRLFRWLTAYPILPDGQFTWCGVRGNVPAINANIYWFSGWAFSVKRLEFFNNVNFQLFDLFEHRLGMGEDVILGYSLSRRGPVKFIDHLCFMHNDQSDSTYTTDYFSYSKRTAFSRLYLSLEFGRLNCYSKTKGTLIYNWYMLCRVVGLSINYLLQPIESRKQILMGAIAGWHKSFFFKFSSDFSRNTYWCKQADIDINLLKG